MNTYCQPSKAPFAERSTATETLLSQPPFWSHAQWGTTGGRGVTSATSSEGSTTTSSGGTSSTTDTTVYTIAVRTGDVFGAGTLANVFATLHGERGDTEEFQLTKPVNGHRLVFARAQSDVFELPPVRSVGLLTALTVRHDNSSSGIGNSWYLDGVQVVDQQHHFWYDFACGHWLAAKKEDRLMSRRLSCTKSKYRSMDECIERRSRKLMAKAEGRTQSEAVDASLLNQSSLPFEHQPFVTPTSEPLVGGKKHKGGGMPPPQMGYGYGGQPPPMYGGGMQPGMRPPGAYGGGGPMRPMGPGGGYGGQPMMMQPGMRPPGPYGGQPMMMQQPMYGGGGGMYGGGMSKKQMKKMNKHHKKGHNKMFKSWSWSWSL